MKSKAEKLVSILPLYTCPTTAYLWNIDAGPEELEVLPHLGGLVLGVEYGQLCEHAHVGALQTQCSLHEGDELVKVAAVLVEVDEVLELVSVHHNVQAAHLTQAELLRLHTRETHLQAGREGRGRAEHLSLTRQHLNDNSHNTSNSLLPHLFPGAGGVGFAGRVDSVLELAEVNEGGGEPGKVGDVVEEQFGRFVHLLLVASLSHL